MEKYEYVRQLSLIPSQLLLWIAVLNYLFFFFSILLSEAGNEIWVEAFYNSAEH